MSFRARFILPSSIACSRFTTPKSRASPRSIVAAHTQPLDILRMSLAKGGTSVLADACLVRGSMTDEESLVAFEWGALLQLGDDLQDVRDDLRSGSCTLFTCAVRNGIPLDALLLQLLEFL